MTDDLLLLGAFAGVGLLVWIVRWTIRFQESQPAPVSTTSAYDGPPAGVPSDGWVGADSSPGDAGSCDGGDGGDGGCGD